MRSQCQETMGIGTCMLMATNVYYAVSSHLLSHLILIMTHWGRYSYFSFTDESTYSEYFRISCKEKNAMSLCTHMLESRCIDGAI